MNNLPLLPELIAKLNDQLKLAGELFKQTTGEGINLSLYFTGTEEGEKGLFKIPELCYRGDETVTTRSTRTFYPVGKGVARILEPDRNKQAFFEYINPRPEAVEKYHANPDLAWVYAFPLLDNKQEIAAALCVSGSQKIVNDEMKEGLEKMAMQHIQTLTPFIAYE